MSKKQAVAGIYDLGQLVIATVQRLVAKKASVSEARTIIAGVNSVQDGLALRQDQARLSGARVNGDVIMDLKLDPKAEPSPSSRVIDMKPTKQLRAKKRK